MKLENLNSNGNLIQVDFILRAEKEESTINYFSSQTVISVSVGLPIDDVIC